MSQNAKEYPVAVSEIRTNTESDNLPVSKETLLQGLRINTRLTLWGVFLASVAINFGYEITLVGGITTVPAFTRVFGIPVPANYKGDTHAGGSDSYIDPYFVSATWIALWAVSHPIGAAIGAGLGGLAQDKIGRRWTLIIGTVWQFVAITICFVADRASTVDARGGIYFAGKVIQGVGIGALMATAHTYISEVLPPSIKGCVTSLIAPFYLLGQVFGAIAVKIANGVTPADPALIPDPNAYRKAIAGQWISSVLPLLLCAFLPESPVYSIRRNNLEAAKKACQRLQGKCEDVSNNLFVRLQHIVHTQIQTEAIARPTTYKDLFRTRSDIHRTFVIAFVMAVPQFLGLTILVHANIIAVSIGMQASRAATYIIIGAVLGLIGALSAFVLLDKVGRRSVLVYSVGFVSVTWLAVGIAGCFQGDITIGPAPLVVQNFLIAMFMSAIFALSIGAWPVSYAIAGETSSLELRAKSQGVAWASNQIMGGVISIIAPYLYNKDQANLGGKIGFIFFALSFGSFVIAILFVPESKGLDVEAMHRLYQGPSVVFRRGRRFIPSEVK